VIVAKSPLPSRPLNPWPAVAWSLRYGSHMSCLPRACIYVHSTSPPWNAGQYQTTTNTCKHAQLSLDSSSLHGFGHRSTHRSISWLHKSCTQNHCSDHWFISWLDRICTQSYRCDVRMRQITRVRLQRTFHNQFRWSFQVLQSHGSWIETHYLLMMTDDSPRYRTTTTPTLSTL